jgi:NAD(P)-dependent dehydrogenase (short-subunit alcohol dehydrogenase family)
MSKTIVITGSSDGIGAAAARRLTRNGHTVVIVGRSPEKTEAVARELGSDFLVADFARFEDVRKLAAELDANYPRIDVLANNAGGVFGDQLRTVDGFEKTVQVNHLSPFLLTNLLMPNLIAAGASVIQTASDASRLFGKIDLDDLDNDEKYSPSRAYGDAKLANILFTTELHARFHNQGLAAASFHPGAVATSFATEGPRFMRVVYDSPLARLFFMTADKGAAQLVWLAETAPGAAWQSGAYYEKSKVATKINPHVGDADLARQLWDRTADMVGLSRG